MEEIKIPSAYRMFRQADGLDRAFNGLLEQVVSGIKYNSERNLFEYTLEGVEYIYLDRISTLLQWEGYEVNYYSMTHEFGIDSHRCMLVVSWRYEVSETDTYYVFKSQSGDTVSVEKKNNNYKLWKK